MKLKNYIEFINESRDMYEVRYDLLKRLKKKVGARNLNTQIEYRDHDRPRSRIQINWNMFDSIYVSNAVNDYSLIDEENWKYVWSNIAGGRIPQDEKGKKFIEHLIDTYKPSSEMIEKLFKRLAAHSSNVVIEYLLPMLDEKAIKDMIWDCLPYGFGYASNKEGLANLLYAFITKFIPLIMVFIPN